MRRRGPRHHQVSRSPGDERGRAMIGPVQQTCAPSVLVPCRRRWDPWSPALEEGKFLLLQLRQKDILKGGQPQRRCLSEDVV